MGEDVKAEAIIDKRIESVVIAVYRPVLPQFLRAQDEYALILQLEILYHRKGLVSFAQTDAVREYAAVVLQDFVDCALGPVPLELEKRPPDARINDLDVEIKQAAFFLVREEGLENMKECLVVNELRGVVLVNLRQVMKHLVLYILDQRVVVPQRIKPGFEVNPVSITVHDEIQLDIAVGRKPQTPHRKIRTAEDRIIHSVRGC